jgi:hypothetical protein
MTVISTQADYYQKNKGREKRPLLIQQCHPFTLVIYVQQIPATGEKLLHPG